MATTSPRSAGIVCSWAAGVPNQIRGVPRGWGHGRSEIVMGGTSMARMPGNVVAVTPNRFRHGKIARSQLEYAGRNARIGSCCSRYKRPDHQIHHAPKVLTKLTQLSPRRVSSVSSVLLGHRTSACGHLRQMPDRRRVGVSSVLSVLARPHEIRRGSSNRCPF